MAKNPFDTLPYPPLIIIPTDSPLSWDDIEGKISDRLNDGVSILVTRAQGKHNRGGFFFHFRKEDNMYMFRTFDRLKVCSFDTGNDLIQFINHVCGYKYSEEIWRLSQKINLRSDKYIS